MNLIRIAQKLSRFFTRQNRASDVLSELIRDKKHREFFNAVKPLDGIKLAFLINGVNKGLDLESMLVEIENNLVSFTVVEFEDVASMFTCNECNGNETISCDYCGGDGYISSDDDDEDDEECDHCGGDGYELCDHCDGNGEIEDDTTTDYNISTYITFDSKLGEDAELLYIDDMEVTKDTLNLNFMNPKLIYLGMDRRSGENNSIDEDYWGNSYVNDIDRENDPNNYIRSNSITVNREIWNLSPTFRG
jgi:hypothetical protein